MIDIKDIFGNVIFPVPITENSKYCEEFVSNSVKLSFSSNQKTKIPEGSYVEFEGAQYTLLKPYSPEMMDECTYKYELEFKSHTAFWDTLPYFYLEQDSTGQETDWTLTGTPSQFMDEVVRNLQKFSGKTFTYSIDATLTGTRSLQFQSSSISGGLSKIADAWNTEWWMEGDVIHLSKCKHGEPVVLIVGENIGVPSVTLNSDGYYTRFYAFGSTRNITQEYNDGSITSHITQKRLKLPLSTCPLGYKDIRPGLQPGEIHIKTLIFDDIYPSSDLSISDVRAEQRYVMDSNGNKVEIRKDEQGNPIYDMYCVWFFKVSGYVCDKNNIIEGLKLSVCFESGQLNGREFEITYHENTYEYEICFDESEGIIIPGTISLIPADGDRIVFFNIKMPQEYTSSAEVRLESELDKEITKRLANRNTYRFKSNPVAFLHENINLKAGSAVLYRNGDETLETRVISIEKRLDCLFEQEIQIGEEIPKGSTQELKEEVVNINKNVNVIKTLNDLSKDIQNAYSRTQKELINSLSKWGDMWFFDKSADTSPGKTDTSKWRVRTKFDLISEGGIACHGFGNMGGVTPGASALSELTDVQLTNLQTGNILQYDGTKWVNKVANFTGTWDSITGKPDFDSQYLKLTGGTLTGNLVGKDITADAFFANKIDVSFNRPLCSGIEMLSSIRINAEGSPIKYFSALSVLSSYVGFQLGTYGGSIEDLRFRKHSDTDENIWTPWRHIWHEGNSNISTVNWNCKDLNAYGWIRSYGNVGWYSQTYSGGIYMEDHTFLRIYGGKKFAINVGDVPNAIDMTGGITIRGLNEKSASPHIQLQNDNTGLIWCIKHGWKGSSDNYLVIYNNYFTDGSNPVIGIHNELIQLRRNTNIYGNLFATGEITCTQPSDRRLKENLKHLDGLKFLRSIQAYEFDWNNKARELAEDNRTHGYGYIAQEVEKILPDFIRNTRESEYLGIQYDKFIPIHGAAIIQLDKVQSEHERRISELEKENKKLQEKLKSE